ncbi:hypothetical protein ACI3LY_005464 [Candidozyma auris]|uniref:Uncharacterized protein n=1 Tax=Candidozyma auris TaxID=498019 RepID=A0A2H0ZIR3_CANAR|nr:hypothetical_protein [[Candida] auris]PIS49575.1 hypothetical protein B9J08_004599 [[Candida] auris]PIS50163.1 hypothetical protein CJI97_004853 [[Candida] auris]PSK77371.1 hypothetical protein CJJ07_002784 [[Candida] auris]QEL62437.1 hypothetical protein CJJ09_004613 [[Candida] auris]QEO23651.1 hypothetical_protein [[Candida] auris]
MAGAEYKIFGRPVKPHVLSLLTLGAVVGIALWPGQKKAKKEVVDQTTKGPKPGDKDEEFDFQKIINDFTKDEK